MRTSVIVLLVAIGMLFESAGCYEAAAGKSDPASAVFFIAAGLAAALFAWLISLLPQQ